MEALTSRSNWNLEVLVFCFWREENRIPKKNPRNKARTNSKRNSHETAGTGVEPGSQSWEESAYPLRHPCYNDELFHNGA